MASGNQAFPTCDTCGNLRKPVNHLDDAGLADFTASTLRKSFQQCPSGGCALLLQAIEKSFPQITPYDRIRARSTGTIILGAGDAKEIRLHVTEGSEHPIWPGIKRGACHEDLSSEESLLFVREHLAKCISDHSACQMRTDKQAYMPTRILDIGNEDDGPLDPHLRKPIRLLISSDVRGDRTYACLSHRWAPSGHTITTTQATYEQRKACISFHELSLLYQDTVHILRRLAIRYVWIDSLCIVQDDATDWQQESKQMAKIYGKALFTLANHTHTTESLRRTSNQHHIISPVSASPPVYVRASVAHFEYNELAFPLLTRGWIYQERLLSPRVVHFTNEEIVWECSEETGCQCGQLNKFRQPVTLPGSHPKLRHAEALGLATRSRVPDEARLRERWRSIVSEYSALDLTKMTDRLPALQGCADQIGEQLHDQYLFGLWTGSSPIDLVWVPLFSSRKYGEPRSPELFQLPTWSWASVCASVRTPEDPPESLLGSWQNPLKSRVVFKEYDNDPCPGQTSTYWLISGQKVPARLARTVPARDKSWLHRAENVELRIASSYIGEGAQPSDILYHGHEFFADFKLFNAGWDGDEEYDVEILRMLNEREEDYCLVLWRYGKAIPGTGVDRVTRDGHPIYQRIGVAGLLPRMSVDWGKAKESTVALE